MCCGSDVRHTGFLQKIFLNAWFSIEVDKNFLHLTPSVPLGVQLMSNKRELLCLVDRHGRMLTNPKWEMKWKKKKSLWALRKEICGQVHSVVHNRYSSSQNLWLYNSTTTTIAIPVWEPVFWHLVIFRWLLSWAIWG